MNPDDTQTITAEDVATVTAPPVPEREPSNERAAGESRSYTVYDTTKLNEAKLGTVAAGSPDEALEHVVRQIISEKKGSKKPPARMVVIAGRSHLERRVEVVTEPTIKIG